MHSFGSIAPFGFIASFDVNSLNGLTQQERAQMAQLAQAGKLRLITRLGLTSWAPGYVPSIGERQIDFKLQQELNKIGFQLEGSAPVTQFVLAFLTSQGIPATVGKVNTLVTRAGYSPVAMMQVERILRNVLGINLSHKTKTKVTEKITITQGKGGTKKSSAKPRHKTNRMLVWPKLSEVREAIYSFYYSGVTTRVQPANTVGMTIYAVAPAVDSHDKAFGTQAYFSADAVLINGQWVVINVDVNSVIRPRTPNVTELVIHDMNMPFTMQLIQLLAQGMASPMSFGIQNPTDFVSAAYDQGISHLIATWTGLILTANASTNTKVAAAREEIEAIVSKGNMRDANSRKRIGALASTVYDEVRTAAPVELATVGAGSESSQFAGSLPSWNPGQTYGQNYGTPNGAFRS